MQEHTYSIFEKHPRTTLFVMIILLLLALYGLLSVKWINNQSIKTKLHQYYVSKIIDNNVGRFIKLREYPPNTVKLERPSRNYIKNIAPNTIERKYYTITTDANGFIGPSDIHASPDLKIVFLGGSTTECLYMEETERFPYLVGRQLEAALNKKVNTYNGGVSANESMHSLNILMNKVLPLKPTMVVLMHNINDLVILRSQGSYGYPHSLKSHVQTSKNVFSLYEFPESAQPVDDQSIQNEFKRNLKTFIAICKIRDIQPVLMTQANRVENDPLYHRFNEIIRETGAEEGVRVIDLAHAIPRTPDMLYDSYHYTAKGAALAAQTITTELQRVL
jgi:lysophospholipase L1-like esterase